MRRPHASRPRRRGRVASVLVAIVTACSNSGQPSVTLPTRATASNGGPPVLLFEERFNDANLSARGWYDLPSGGLMSLSTGEHIAGAAASLELSFPQGASTPIPAAMARHGFAPAAAVYVRYWVKHSSDWVGAAQGFGVHELYLVTTNDDDPFDGPESTHLTTDIGESFEPSGGFPRLSAQDVLNIDTTRIDQNLTTLTEFRAVSGCNGESDDTPTTCTRCDEDGTSWCNGKRWTSDQPAFLQAAGPGYKGDWHKVEAYFKLNSIAGGVGQRDGIARYWVDGALVMDHSNVIFRTAAHASMQFDQLILAPMMDASSPVSQALWIDDLVVMTGPPSS